MTETVAFKHVFTAQSPGNIDDFYSFEKDKHDKRRALGEGSYGHVYKAKRNDTKQIRAIKAIDLKKLSDPTRFEQEITIQQSLDHPNIVKLYEVFKDARKMYLVMELCTGGELFDRIVEEAEKNGEGTAFDERRAATYMQQILGAMRYLHMNSFVHRDIKPENFLLASKSADAQIKVIDFGLAKKYKPGDNRMKTKAGTPYYVSPQVLQGSYNEKCDIWSCGVIAYILLCGYPPFYGDTDEDILRRVKRGKFDFPSPDWDDISKDAKLIIKKMLDLDDERRPSAEALLEDKWLSMHAIKPTGTVPKNLGANLKSFTKVPKMKKIALSLVAQQLAEKDIEAIKETFKLLDKNNDGTLSMEEIVRALEEQGMEDGGLRETLRDLDTDGSGSVDYTEFIAATIERSQYFRKDVLWSAFRTFDKDGDGTITKEELKKMLEDETLKGAQLDAFVDKVIKEVDLDGDGVISYEEFTAMMDKPASDKSVSL